MGAVGDALQALQKVVLIQANIERLQQDFARIDSDLRGVKDFVNQLDRRVVRIETMIEMSRGVPPQPPRIEG